MSSEWLYIEQLNASGLEIHTIFHRRGCCRLKELYEAVMDTAEYDLHEALIVAVVGGFILTVERWV